MPAASNAKAVRIHARNVRSLAKVNRGSGSLPTPNTRCGHLRCVRVWFRSVSLTRSPHPVWSGGSATYLCDHASLINHVPESPGVAISLGDGEAHLLRDHL